jgi:hypothetical protein
MTKSLPSISNELKTLLALFICSNFKQDREAFTWRGYNAIEISIKVKQTCIEKKMFKVSKPLSAYQTKFLKSSEQSNRSDNTNRLLKFIRNWEWIWKLASAARPRIGTKTEIFGKDQFCLSRISIQEIGG